MTPSLNHVSKSSCLCNDFVLSFVYLCNQIILNPAYQARQTKNETVMDSMILKAVGKGSIFSLYQHILRYIAIAMVILLAIGLLAGI